MFKTTKIILSFLFLISLSLKAQNTETTQIIRGTVTDAASGTPLPYVTIIISDLPGTGAVTDSVGKFVINQIPIGRHTVQASFIGYEPAVFNEVLVTSAKETFLEFSLKENIQQLNEVVVRPKTNKDQPLNTMALAGGRMLSVEEASRFAGGMDDPARLVSSFAGIASSVASNGISIHGNAPSLLQWRFEGVEIPNPNHFADINTLGGGIMSSLSSNVLGNSDFFTGAFPAEYNNAVSGVFDMNLRNGNNRKMENAVQLGILGLDIASEGPLSKKSDASYIFNYRYSTMELLKLANDIKYQDLNFKVNMPTRNAGTFSVWGTGYIDKIDEFEDNPAEWEYHDDNKQSIAKQYSAAVGISHRYLFRNYSSLKTTLAATHAQQNADEYVYDEDMTSNRFMDFKTKNTNIIFTTAYNRKFSSRLTTKSGFTYTQMFYDMNMKLSPFENEPLQTISSGNGNTSLVSAYISSVIGLSDKVTMNLGVNAQYLTLNNNWTIEPRTSIKWQMTPKSSLALAYGLHSRMEKMDVYFVKTPATGDELVNKNLDFTKAHHIMLSYNYKISDDMSLRIEPYFQYIFDVPVIADSSYSILNRKTFYVEDVLVNRGKGRNIGIDITLEKYLSRGFYYMITASFFDSKYRGGDGEWYDTRFNRNYIANALIGKEWMVGSKKQNMLSLNLKFTYQGGDRHSPVDMEATNNHPDKEVMYDETKPFSEQYPSMFIMNASASFKINKRKVSHEFAVKTINATGTKDYYGYGYNMKTGEVEKLDNSMAIPNIYYKLNF
ncbi:MAG: TonB-dependent receptor [Tannerella sp.]|jgi:hypothetical protein|nr:TonB-dependent receptor [Tannerella sp.]